MTRAYLWTYQRLYNEFAWSYDATIWLVSMARWSTWRRLALEYALSERKSPIGPLFGDWICIGSLLCDLACLSFPEKVEPVYGSNIHSTAMQKRTTIKLKQTGLDVLRVQSRSQELPFAGHSFATIISTFSASYIFEQQTLVECVRVLYPPSTRSRTNKIVTHEYDVGRLVIVGAWVAPKALWFRRLSLPFYGMPTETQIEQITAERFHKVGLTSTFHRHDGPVRLRLGDCGN